MIRTMHVSACSVNGHGEKRSCIASAAQVEYPPSADPRGACGNYVLQMAGGNAWLNNQCRN
jgi:hypothetical protein